MKDGQTLWTKDELLLAINLYSKIPFGQMHRSNPEVKDLAELTGRSIGAIVRKLGNFASFDPKLKERGVGGLPNVSKLDKQVWAEYIHNWDETFIEGEKLLAQKKHTTIQKLYHFDLKNFEEIEGREEHRRVAVRLNQSIFRKLVLSNYNNQCCITGISITELLVASHILPWSVDKNNRLNPRNGLSLNTLHDKAFDKGLITITEDYKIKISAIFMKHQDVLSIKQNFIDYDGRDLIAAQKFSPGVEFLKAHHDRFKP